MLETDEPCIALMTSLASSDSQLVCRKKSSQQAQLWDISTNKTRDGCRKSSHLIDKIIFMKILSHDTQVLPYQVSNKFSKTFPTRKTLGKSQAAKRKKCRREGIGMERKESYWFCNRTFHNDHLWTEKSGLCQRVLNKSHCMDCPLKKWPLVEVLLYFYF